MILLCCLKWSALLYCLWVTQQGFELWHLEDERRSRHIYNLKWHWQIYLSECIVIFGTMGPWFQSEVVKGISVPGLTSISSAVAGCLIKLMSHELIERIRILQKGYMHDIVLNDLRMKLDVSEEKVRIITSWWSIHDPLVLMSQCGTS